MISGPKKAVSVLMPLKLYERVKEQAEKKHKTVPGYVRQVVRRYLWHVENAPEALTKEWDIV